MASPKITKGGVLMEYAEDEEEGGSEELVTFLSARSSSDNPGGVIKPSDQPQSCSDDLLSLDKQQNNGELDNGNDTEPGKEACLKDSALKRKSIEMILVPVSDRGVENSLKKQRKDTAAKVATAQTGDNGDGELSEPKKKKLEPSPTSTDVLQKESPFPAAAKNVEVNKITSPTPASSLAAEKVLVDIPNLQKPPPSPQPKKGAPTRPRVRPAPVPPPNFHRARRAPMLPPHPMHFQGPPPLAPHSWDERFSRPPPPPSWVRDCPPALPFPAFRMQNHTARTLTAIRKEPVVVHNKNSKMKGPQKKPWIQKGVADILANGTEPILSGKNLQGPQQKPNEVGNQDKATCTEQPPTPISTVTKSVENTDIGVQTMSVEQVDTGTATVRQADKEVEARPVGCNAAVQCSLLTSINARLCLSCESSHHHLNKAFDMANGQNPRVRHHMLTILGYLKDQGRNGDDVWKYQYYANTMPKLNNHGERTKESKNKRGRVGKSQPFRNKNLLSRQTGKRVEKEPKAVLETPQGVADEHQKLPKNDKILGVEPIPNTENQSLPLGNDGKSIKPKLSTKPKMQSLQWAWLIKKRLMTASNPILQKQDAPTGTENGSPANVTAINTLLDAPKSPKENSLYTQEDNVEV